MGWEETMESSEIVRQGISKILEDQEPLKVHGPDGISSYVLTECVETLNWSATLDA